MKVIISPELRELIIRESPTRLLANKCILFCSELFLKAAEHREQESDQHEYFRLMAVIGENIYTRRAYARMKQLLVDIGAIEICHQYLPTATANKLRSEKKVDLEPFSKGYRLCSKFMDGVEFELDDPKLEKRFEDAMARASYAAMSTTPLKWILFSYKHTSFKPGAEDILAALNFKSDKARALAYHHFQTVAARKPRFMPKDSGRLYYPIASLRRPLRPQLLLDGEEVAEIDIAACQPTLLATLYDPLKHAEERGRYLQLVQGSRFYEQFASWSGENWSRDEAKEQFFNQIAYGSAYCKESYPLLPIFEDQFPILAGLMHQIKRQGNSVLPIRMQILEAKIVIQGAIAELAGGAIMALPVHDALIIRRRDAFKAAEILGRHWKKETGIQARIKGLPEDGAV